MIPIEITAVKPFEKKTLRAFVDFELTDIGLIIRGATLHQKEDGSRWISLPSREYTKDGERTWSPILECRDRAALLALQDSILVALDHHLASNPGAQR